MWPFKAKPKPVEVPVADATRKLYGYDLDTEWHYLGSTHSDGYDVDILFFVSQKNDKIRDYIVVGRDTNILNFKRYSAREKIAVLWKACENASGSLYGPIGEPSNYLHSYMLKTGGWIWDTDKNWWVCAPNAGYVKAVANQPTTAATVPAVIATKENVLTVDFKKKDVDSSK